MWAEGEVDLLDRAYSIADVCGLQLHKSFTECVYWQSGIYGYNNESVRYFVI